MHIAKIKKKTRKIAFQISSVGAKGNKRICKCDIFNYTKLKIQK